MATENDKVNTGALATLVAVGTAAMIGICLAVNALVRHEIGNVGAERDAVGADAYRTLRREQLDKLTAPAAWSNREKGQVSIPIERAMTLVLTDLKRSPWNATPAPPPDAGADAALEAADAGADAATADAATADAADAGAAPEPPASAPLSPSAAPPAPTVSTAPGGAPATKPSTVPPPGGSIQPVPRPLQTTPTKPPAPPIPPSAQPPATP
jgi:hypothetical protein